LRDENHSRIKRGGRNPRTCKQREFANVVLSIPESSSGGGGRCFGRTRKGERKDDVAHAKPLGRYSAREILSLLEKKKKRSLYVEEMEKRGREGGARFRKGGERLMRQRLQSLGEESLNRREKKKGELRPSKKGKKGGEARARV